MAESPRKASAWAWLALGAGLSLLPLWAHPLALLGSWLAQPALALGLGGVRGLRVSALGNDGFGQTGDLQDLYRVYRLDADAIIDAAAELFAPL